MRRPHCDATGFGWIEIDGQRYEHDVLIRLGGKIKRRKKKLSKQVYGTSHTLSRAEAEHVFEEGARVLIVGTGQDGCVSLSPEAAEYLTKREVEVRLQRTPQALEAWNAAGKDTVGLFHVTC
ncbi:MAG TPA: MTH938/NDUFAF3 family protein [Gemmatimonadales bacterium]|nr:MTH938/NDUFAF3 family protein [Gemmatimonadales bacterium]